MNYGDKEGVSPLFSCLRPNICSFLRDSTVVLFSPGVRQAGCIGGVPPIHTSPAGVREGWRHAGVSDFAQEASSDSCATRHDGNKGNPGDPILCLTGFKYS